MPIPERIDTSPLSPEENAETRAMLVEWPRVKAVVDRYEKARAGFVEWITGVLARNPKLSNAVTLLVGAILTGASVWFAKPVPPPEKVLVPVPVETRPAERPAEPQRPAAQPSLEQPKTPPPAQEEQPEEAAKEQPKEPPPRMRPVQP